MAEAYRCHLFCYGRALGITGNESANEIEQLSKKAFRERSRIVHPDKNPDHGSLATRAQQLLNTANQILTDKYTAFSYLQQGKVSVKDHQGKVTTLEHRCCLNADLIQFIKDRVKDKFEKTASQQAEAEISRLKEELKRQSDSLHELQSTLEAKEQSIDQLNISLSSLEDKLKSTEAVTKERTRGPPSPQDRNPPAKRFKPTDRQKQGCQIVELKFRATGPQFRVKWKHCGATTLHRADEIAEHFPDETKAFLIELKENGSKQIDTLYKRDIKELVDLM